jgi:hypothetical protein
VSDPFSLDGRVAEFHFNRAAVQRYLGDAAGAEASFNTAIELNPRDYEAYNGRAQLHTQTPDHNHLAQLRQVIAATQSPVGLIQQSHLAQRAPTKVGIACVLQIRMRERGETARRIKPRRQFERQRFQEFGDLVRIPFVHRRGTHEFEVLPRSGLWYRISK